MCGLNEYVLDPIERGEARVEQYDAGGDKVFCCNCKQAVHVDKVECVGADPYSPPICHDCLNAKDCNGRDS